MVQMQGLAIETHGLGKKYGEVEALEGLNLQVPRNSIFGFLGPNGSGKSTTIKLLLGLIKPTGGSGLVFGKDIVKESMDVRRRVGYLAQDPQFIPHMTARETLRFAARFFYSGSPAAIEARIEEILALVGLEDKADRPIDGFSGGERQRLGIAQAQINTPDLLILDEPAAALDPQGRHDVLNIMNRLREHTTIFFSTHILDDVQRVSDRVAILNAGSLVAQAPIEELLTGSRQTIYSLSVKGKLQDTLSRLQAIPWVTSIHRESMNGNEHWTVIVGNENLAERQLLRTVLEDEEIMITEFGRKKYELEEIFLQIVEGANHGSN